MARLRRGSILGQGSFPLTRRSAKVFGSVRSDTTIYRPRVRQSPRRIALRRAAFLGVVLGVLLLLLGLAFAGSQTELAAGTNEDGDQA